MFWNITSLGVSLLIVVMPVASARAQSAFPEIRDLGRVAFSNSCSPDVQTAITRGVAALHSFQYLEAEAVFAEAATHNARCPMVYWGRAMAVAQFLWRSPSAGNLGTGLAYVKDAEKLAAPTDRERRYIASMAAFYQDDIKLSYIERVQAFSAVLARLTEKYPDDVDGAAFYALSLITLAQLQTRGSIEDLDYRTRALAILEPLFGKHPDHPGLAHYIIHAADSPELASQGVEAARRYARLAPGSPHALHMPSHIFLWLGLWKDAVVCNLAAIQAGQSATPVLHGGAEYTLHAVDFLNYAYLQSGDGDKARALVAQVATVPGADARQVEFYQTLLSARNALELHQWKQAASLPDPGRTTRAQGVVFWVRAVGAARSGDIAAAQEQVQKLLQLQGTFLWNKVQFEESEAWLDHAEGKDADAVNMLRSAAEDQRPEAADSLQMPAREMLGDLLFELKRPSEALAEYKSVLATNRNRYNALLGAVRAAHASGLKDEAIHYYRMLLAGVAEDTNRLELSELNALLQGAK